ncbi:MAG TPA: pyruvate dehydrogenase (acetyl-transferring) E1 component subunit alpha, partial [Chromatiales bacterium]|nr:pyruvate dehydrogenase (acetyl-transferring) E1 component subunit alpha [Chromatiales bacterium]
EIHRHSALPEVYKRACAYRIPARRIDGMDVLAVYHAAHEALAQVRAGNGPQLLEFETYRFRGHSMADSGNYRPRVEVQAYERNEDPLDVAIAEAAMDYPAAAQLTGDHIGRFTEQLGEDGHLNAEALETMKAEVAAEVEAAVAFAENSPEPAMEDARAALDCNRHGEVLL